MTVARIDLSRTAAWVLSVAALGALTAVEVILSAPIPNKNSPDDGDWSGFGRTADEQHFSPLDTINASSIHKLGLAWSFDLPPGNPASAPIAVNGILYLATGYSVVRAIDAASGKLLWAYDPKAPQAAGRKLRSGWGIRGLAYGEGKIFVGTHDGRLVALNAANGSVAWQVQTLPTNDLSYITGAPRYFAGKVIIGFGGADVDNVRGYVTTYDAASGKQLWRFYVVPGNPAKGFEDDAMKRAAATWAGDWWKLGGGGTVWNAMTYDGSTNTIVLGTGNGAPWNHAIRSEEKGDNLFLSSIVGLDASTGAYKWHYQVNPGDTWDYNASMDIELADLQIAGKVRKVLLTAPKDGFFYVIDRTNGQLVSAEPFVKVSWASRIDLATGRPVENPQARYHASQWFDLWPGNVGGHSWLPMAFSPRTKLVYIPAIEMATAYSDAGFRPGSWHRHPGGTVDDTAHINYVVKDAGPLNATSSLLAWDPVRQRAAWRIATPGPWNGGVMATAGNLVFQGKVDGTFNGYAADTGKPLWSFAAQAPVIAPPISYLVHGKQYVTVLAGMGTSGAAFGPLIPGNIDYRTQARRVLTFAIGGTATLPKAQPFHLVPIVDADYRPDPIAAQRGMAVYGSRCSTCHGANMVAQGHAPDLRTSTLVADRETFDQVVHGGLLVPNGMPKFEELAELEVADVRQYIRSEAKLLRVTINDTPADRQSALSH